MDNFTFELTLHDITEQIAIADIEYDRAYKNHNIGDIFWYKDLLYKVSSNINAGDIIIPGTNCINTTLIDAMKN